MSFGVRGNHSRSRRFPNARGRRPDNKSYRQSEATRRQAEYDKLTLEQKFALLKDTPGESKRQFVKLSKMIETKKLQMQAKAAAAQNKTAKVQEKATVDNKAQSRVEKFLAKAAIAKKA
jgi:hypothetical protein